MIRIAKVALENTADYHTFEFFEHTTIVEFRKQIRDNLGLGAIHFDLLGTDNDGDITFVSTMKDLQENYSDVTLRLHLAKKNGNPSKTEKTLDPASSSTTLPQLKEDLQGTPIKSYPFCHHQHHHHHQHYCAHSSNDASFQRLRSGIQSAELVDDEPDTPIILNPGHWFKKHGLSVTMDRCIGLLIVCLLAGGVAKASRLPVGVCGSPCLVKQSH